MVDREGVLWGIQSQTKHLELGFGPEATTGKNQFLKNQFLNVGWAVHPETIAGFLEKHDIQFEWAD